MRFTLTPTTRRGLSGPGKRFICVLLACAAAGLLCRTAAAQKTTSAPVTAVVFDNDTAVPPNQLLLRGDDPVDHQATYTNTANAAGTKGVSNVLFVPNGPWQFFLGNQSLRKIWVTLSQRVGSSPPAPAPDGFYYDKTELFSTCYTGDGSGQLQATGLLSITPGTSNNICVFGVDFAYAGVKYQLAMGPAHANSGLASVICNGGPDANTCNNWTIVPNVNAANPTVANLYQFARDGSLKLIGQYYNTFRINVTNP